MKKSLSLPFILPCLAASVLVAAALPARAAAFSGGALHVEGTQLMDSQGNPAQLKGISTHGLAWFPEYVNETCFHQLRTQWDVDVIRLAMYTAQSGGYCTDGDKEALKQLIRDGVSLATDQGLYVIIDWHILSDSNPNTYLEEASEFFGEMSAEYAGQDNVLYEICNEPNGGTSWADIRAYALEIIPLIRANDPDSIILIGTPNWSQYVEQAAADPITEYDNLMYTLHFYAATHTDSLRSALTSAVEAGLPVFVSEYGICDASGSGAINEVQANAWMQLLDEYQISCIAWNLSNKNETSAILKNTCQKTGGFTEEDLSDSGKWLYQMLTGQGLAAAEGNDSPSLPSDHGDISVSIETAASALDPGDLAYTLNLMDSWESGGQSYYRYDLTLTNSTQKPLKSWKLTLGFGGSFSLSDGWNGKYTCDGNTLEITPMDYNKEIAAGDTLRDIGFILCSSDF